MRIRDLPAAGRMPVANGPVVPLARRRDPRSFYTVKAAEKKGEADIYLYDVIGDSWDGTTAKMFAADLKELGEVGRLNIYINSSGGSVFDGTAIFNQLVRHKARKVVTVDGIAASIASVVAMAGDEINIAANGMMMIHDPWARAIGGAAEFRKMAETLDQIRGTILGTYVRRTTATEDQLSDWMSAETWFDAEAAVDAGLADAIVDEVAMAALAKHDLSDFRHVPGALQAAAKAAAKSDDTENPGGEGDTAPAAGSDGTSRRPHSAITTMSARLMRRGIRPTANAAG